MANLNGFNAHDVDPNTGFDPIPAGKYLAAMTYWAAMWVPISVTDGQTL